MIEEKVLDNAETQAELAMCIGRSLMSLDEAESSLALKNFRPRLRLDPLLRPIHRFMDIESSGGLVLLVATLIALFLANTSLAGWYASIWETKASFAIGSLRFEMSILQVINDGLMTLFFFVVGLEIKREIVLGELQSLAKASFPVAAAVGGMMIPAAIYLAFQHGLPTASGWAIPMATDIAFVVGFLSLLGRRVPYGLKITLLTLAIADDLGAVLVIALVYAHGFVREYFFAGLGFYLLIFLFNFLGVRRVLIYAGLGAAMWYCIYRSGVHPTVAGVLLGLATPTKRLMSHRALNEFMDHFQSVFKIEAAEAPVDREPLRKVSYEAVSPLERLLNDLHPWVSFFIMPLFALANAGVPIEVRALETSLAWAVILGLLLGKPIGIFGAAWLSTRIKGIQFPRGVSPSVFLAASLLCGVGFTMSIFISGLALSGEELILAKTGVLLGSAFSAVAGLWLLHKTLPRREEDVINPEGQEYPAS
jgi:NhaA family Na+:H+ antiporter